MMKTCLLAALLFLVPLAMAAQWTPLYPAKRDPSRALYVHDAFMLAGGAGGLFRSTNGGTDWLKLPGAVASLDGTSVYAMDDTLYYGSTLDVAFRSTDAGLTWQKMAMTLDAGKGIWAFHYRKGMLLAGGYNGISILDDTVWRLRLLLTEKLRTTYSLVGNSSTMFLGDRDYGVAYSTDDGETWLEPVSGAPAGRVPGFLATEEYAIAGYSGRVPIRSTDNGRTWSPMPINGDKIFALSFAEHNGLLIAGTNKGVYASTDAGATWRSKNEGWPDTARPQTYVIKVFRDTVYIGTGLWVWKRPLSELLPPSGVDDATAGLRATTLGAAVPNPASGDVRIPYTMAASGNVNITLYDALLQHVATVVDEVREAGHHTARFNTAELPNGVYYYRLNTGGRSLTKSLVILR